MAYSNARGVTTRAEVLAHAPGCGDPVDASTRTRVIEAAVACILEEGFYRASSNKIARRAGVTWGVIQYHFGTREGLLVAVNEYAAAQFDTACADAQICGVTIHERLDSLADVIWSYYRRPEFLAYMQLTLNLSHDPTAAERTRDGLCEAGKRFGRHLPRLMRSVLGDEIADGAQFEVLSAFLFSVIRGLALDHEVSDALPVDRRAQRPDPDPQRAMLVDALSAYVQLFALR